MLICGPLDSGGAVISSKEDCSLLTFPAKQYLNALYLENSFRNFLFKTPKMTGLAADFAYQAMWKKRETDSGTYKFIPDQKQSPIITVGKLNMIIRSRQIKTDRQATTFSLFSTTVRLSFLVAEFPENTAGHRCLIKICRIPM